MAGLELVLGWDWSLELEGRLVLLPQNLWLVTAAGAGWLLPGVVAVAVGAGRCAAASRGVAVVLLDLSAAVVGQVVGPSILLGKPSKRWMPKDSIWRRTLGTTRRMEFDVVAMFCAWPSWSDETAWSDVLAIEVLNQSPERGHRQLGLQLVYVVWLFPEPCERSSAKLGTVVKTKRREESLLSESQASEAATRGVYTAEVDATQRRRINTERFVRLWSRTSPVLEL